MYGSIFLFLITWILHLHTRYRQRSLHCLSRLNFVWLRCRLCAIIIKIGDIGSIILIRTYDGIHTEKTCGKCRNNAVKAWVEEAEIEILAVSRETLCLKL